MTENSIPFSGLARGLRFAAAGGTVALPAIVVLAMLRPAGGQAVTAFIDAGGLPPAWSAALALAYALLVSVALVELCRMLRRVEQGDAFSPIAIAHFRGFTAWLASATIMSVVAPVVALSVRAALDGQRQVTLDLDGSDALLLLLNCLLFLVARLFEAAARYQDDSRAIV